ncbi:Terpene synthase metal-binding domain protein-like protein [Leptotrombidium deliense]|uniref:Terpene synthase n=1 Tax=Leptotrombidium deliense TaxID=299467 RepID=A0A443ST25_9ACAR|nr:Terpene synthase metal-binding domain protein-like protein [Leptotrombidium deliense]
MEPLVFPKIEWKNEATNHKEVDKLEKELNDWLSVYCKAAGMNGSLVSHKLSYFSTRIWHYGSYERVLAIAKLIAYFFVVDDFFDVMDRKWTRYQYGRLIEIALNDEIVPLQGDNWFQACWSDLWQSFTRLANNEWKYRLINSCATWFKGAELELKFKQSKKIPSLVEYLTLRPFSEGGEFCFNFIEFAANKYLSQNTLSNPVFNSLLQYSRLVLFATNDLYSFRKETKKGDVMNLVMVYHNEYKISTQEAIYKTVEFIQENLKIFESYKDQLVSALIPDDDMQFYVSGLEAMFRGNYDFHFDSKRY